MKQHSMILSLGTNNHDGIAILSKAESIINAWIGGGSCSRKLRNPAIGMGEGADDFYNMLIKKDTTLSLSEMNDLSKKLESMMGNTAELRKDGIVMMDMDIVEWDGEPIKPKDTEREYYQTLIKEL